MARAKKAYTPRVIGQLVNANIAEDIIDIADPDEPGKVIKRKQGRRASNVFESLFVSGRITSEQRHAAMEMVETYALSKGLGGIGERNLDRVQFDAADPMTQMRIRAEHGRQFEEIMQRLDQDYDILIRALIKDFVHRDGAAIVVIDDHGTEAKWRGVVREVCQKRSIPCRKTYEGAPVATALQHLVEAVIDYRKMVARNREAQRRQAS